MNKLKIPQKIKIGTFCITLLVLFFSCNGKYAVGLMDTEQIKANKIYKVKGKTFIKIAYKPIKFFILDDGKKEIQERAAVVEYFESKRKAQAFQKKYKEIENLYARATTNHYIRPSQNPNAPNSYRLKKGEVIKILHIGEEKVVNNHKGKWLHVISKSGYKGYSFNSNQKTHLEIFDSSVNSEIQNKDKSKNKLTEILKAHFYPQEYIRMIDSNIIDLNKINCKNGFYIDEIDTDIIHFKTESLAIDFSVNKISEINENNYDSNEKELHIQIINKKNIQIQFLLKEKNYTYDLIIIENIKNIILEEEKSRSEFMKKLLNIGKIYISNTYGTLKIDENQKFVWTNFDTLVPGHIPQGAKTQGRFSFEIHMTPQLEQRYDDALIFYFKANNGTVSATFFIDIEESKKAIRLRSVPPILINNDNLIERDNLAPQIIYFKAAN